jgi:hypothetical protein
MANENSATGAPFCYRDDARSLPDSRLRMKSGMRTEMIRIVAQIDVQGFGRYKSTVGWLDDPYILVSTSTESSQANYFFCGESGLRQK